MKKILIIEDNQRQRDYLVATAKKINDELVVLSTDSFDKAYQLAMKNTISVFFIDVEIIGGSGLDLAKELREDERYAFAPMIFITGKTGLELTAFKSIHCYDFIHKPYVEQDIHDTFNKILKEFIFSQPEEKRYFDLEFRGVKQRVNQDDIIFVESRNRRLVIQTKYEEIKYKYMSVKKALEKLGDEFVQVHQAYVVNCNYINKIDMSNQTIELMKNDHLVPIGSSYKKSVGSLF